MEAFDFEDIMAKGNLDGWPEQKHKCIPNTIVIITLNKRLFGEPLPAM